MANQILVGEGGSFDADGGAIVDFSGVDLFIDLLFIEMRYISEDYHTQQKGQ
jgi:hypothetical protein